MSCLVMVPEWIGMQKGAEGCRGKHVDSGKSCPVPFLSFVGREISDAQRMRSKAEASRLCTPYAHSTEQIRMGTRCAYRVDSHTHAPPPRLPLIYLLPIECHLHLFLLCLVRQHTKPQH